jgi:hypothetical protein
LVTCPPRTLVTLKFCFEKLIFELFKKLKCILM